jgi:hypothetical protein
MARCGWRECGVWRPNLVARHGSGIVLEDVWYCCAECVERTAVERLQALTPAKPSTGTLSVARLRLGMLLVHQGDLSPVQLDVALEAQRTSRLRLGEQLQRLSLVSRVAVLRALAAQSSTPYLTTLDPRQVRQLPRVLGPSAVSALGLVPFDADPSRQHMKVACAAPVPRLALRALTELTGWVADPFLVSDDQMPPLLAAYGRGTQDEQRSDPGALTVQAAAAQIARRAAAGSGARMTQVACDPFVWVRLEGKAGMDDVIVRTH